MSDKNEAPKLVVDTEGWENEDTVTTDNETPTGTVKRRRRRRVEQNSNGNVSNGKPSISDNQKTEPVRVEKPISEYNVEYISITLEIPVLKFNAGSVCQHINLQGMTPKMRIACERIKRGCRSANVSINNGRPVVTGVDTTRYLFEQIAAAMDISEEDVTEAFGG